MADQHITDKNQATTSNMRYLAGGLFIILLLGITIPGYGQQQNVTLVANPANGAAPEIKDYILQIRQSINHSQKPRGITLPGNHPAIGRLNDLIDTNNITSIRLADFLHLLSHPGNTYEVRDIYVKTADTGILEYRALSLKFNAKAELTDVQLLAEIYNYQLALDRNVLASPEKREAVITQIHQFQDALVNKSFETISSMFSPDAHIVKGGVNRYFYNDSFGPYYKFAVLTAEGFARDIADKNQPKYIIKYHSIDVYKFPDMHNTFVATFQQKWTTGKYTDYGHVAMIVDLQKKTIPLRVWQGQPFQTGYLQQQMPPVTKMTIPMPRPTFNLNAGFVRNTAEEQPPPSDPGFFRSNKRWLLLSAGATAVISIGAALLGGGGENGELPNPPGRPAMR